MFLRENMNLMYAVKKHMIIIHPKKKKARTYYTCAVHFFFKKTYQIIRAKTNKILILQ